MPEWKETWRQASLEELLPEGVVRCHLSPRNCTMREGQNGFCGVRGNRGGRLITMNYGKSVHVTEETIETEAVNHYSPGERILSLGNIGCMLNCAYCHNWKTSQSRYVEDRDVYSYTSEGVIEFAIRHGIRCLSWTYNDPVVWHEFVRDTSKLAHEAGLINLYKSAFFITAEAIDELLPHIDIFSISVKSMDPVYYGKYTTGWLQPVLDGCKQVLRAGKHLEVSNLMITDVSDDEQSARKIAEWHLRELNQNVPLHFVRFHPDYKMRDTVRTPIDRLVRAREIALEMGVEHVYLGNVYNTPYSNTYCRGCDKLLVKRYGLNATIFGLDAAGRCTECGRDGHFKLMPEATHTLRSTGGTVGWSNSANLDWHGDIRAAHVQVLNTSDNAATVCFRRRYPTENGQQWRTLELEAGESYRFAAAQSSPEEIGIEVTAPDAVRIRLHELYDRAHFPTVSIEEERAETDIFPLPLFPGKLVKAVAASVAR
jgi:pyruvate formate lyase activating enzyme